MSRSFVALAAILAFIGVGIGAFGAHALAATLTANGRADTFETGVQYHLIHALAIFGVAWAVEEWPGRLTRAAGWLFAVGIIVFSGSLYLLAITNTGILGAITPLGGLAFLAGWACLGLAAWRAKK